MALAALAERRLSTGIGIDLEHRDRFFPELVDRVAVSEPLDWLEPLTASQFVITFRYH